jgi:hypothetical protein
MRRWDEFITIVDRHFKYLETEFGLKRISTEIPFVIYESPFFNIKIFWEYGGRYELDLAIVLPEELNKYRYDISIGMLAVLHGSNRPEDYDWLLVNTKGKLEMGVKELADLLRKYGTKLLLGDSNEIKKVQKLIER